MELHGHYYHENGGQADRPDVDMAKGVADRPHRCGSVGIVIYHPWNEWNKAQHG